MCYAQSKQCRTKRSTLRCRGLLTAMDLVTLPCSASLWGVSLPYLWRYQQMDALYPRPLFSKQKRNCGQPKGKET